MPCNPPKIGEKVRLTGFGFTSMDNRRPSKYLRYYNSTVIKCPKSRFYDDIDLCVETTSHKYACPVSLNQKFT